MQHMWSPWRSEHIERATGREEHEAEDRAELFTRIAEADRDEENYVLWRGDEVFVVMNLYPYNNGHLMIVPYRQVQHYEELTWDEQQAVARTIDRCIRWIRHALSPDGFNVGINLGKAAGAGIPEHLHVHVVPRWSGDTNFMPTVGEVKVIPEAMQKTYAKLRSAVTTLEDDSSS